MHKTRPESKNLSVKILCLLLRYKAHTESMFACSTNIHGEQIIHSLDIETLSIEVCKSGSNFLKALCCLLHGGLLTQNNRAGLSVSVYL